MNEIRYLLFDLNSFFASCEQQMNPRLRGKPVAVVPMVTNSTSVIAASIEAKRFGIKTGTKVGDAKKMCPGIVLIEGHHRNYTEFHHQICAAVEEVLPIKKVLSIDEMVCEFIGSERAPQKALQIAQNMKDHVRHKVGSELRSSVGIGPNILIAKIASDMQKPDGLVLIKASEISLKIGHLPIEAIPGIGRRMKAHLNTQGFFKISDLLKVSEPELRRHWKSIWGLRVAHELRGKEFAFKDSPEQKSISRQHVLPPNFRNTTSAFQVCLKLLMKAQVTLRKEKQKTTGLSVFIRYIEHDRFENSIYFSPTHDFSFLSEQLKFLWSTVDCKLKPIKVCVVLSGLTSGAEQLSFFDDPKSSKRNEALDLINSKFGPNTLYLASTQAVLETGKTRIAFKHIPDKDDEF